MRFNRESKKRYLRLGSLLIVIILIRVFAENSLWVERYYANGFFPWFSGLFRIITGWLQISIGDLLYLFAAFYLLFKLVRFSGKLFKKPFPGKILLRAMTRIFVTAILIYIVFNIFWGLNYNRKGISYQLGLTIKDYDTADLINIQQLLLQKVNARKQALIYKREHYPGSKELFSRAGNCYRQAERLYPFLQYAHKSVKPSLFSYLGNYLGFTGYYNPFSGEAQVNTTVPAFVLPYTTCHEIAHQLGYAKEDEANFVGYLSATSSDDTLFHYSTYMDLFLYANREVFYFDSVLAKQAFNLLLPGVKRDLKEYRDFLLRYRSPIEPIITWAYGKYLNANQQPKGMRTYNEVIADLIAFYKKFGKI